MFRAIAQNSTVFLSGSEETGREEKREREGGRQREMTNADSMFQ